VSVDREFFVSFAGADQPWAAWLLAELDAAGYSSVSQLRDFVAGANFVTEMHQAARRARRTLGVLSPHALRAPFVWQEWAQRLAGDPTGERRALVLVRVEPCEPEGLLGPVVYVDLVGLDEAGARARLRDELAAVARGERRLADDPETGWSLNNLAVVLQALGELDAARTLHEHALAIRETRLGTDHPDTVRSRQRLAAVVTELDKQQ
jgi:hypothetical protein